MASIVTSEITTIADPKIRQLATRVIREFELTALKVACNHADAKRWPLPPERDSLEAVLATRFRTLPAALKDSAAARALTQVDVTPAAREARFGDLANVNLTVARSIDLQVRQLTLPSELKLRSNFLSILADKPPPAITTAPALTSLEFRILSVKCVDETDGVFGSEAGSDEISIGGTTVDESGDTEKAAVFKVGSFGKDGAVKTFSPPHSLAVYDLTKARLFPSFYFMTLVLAEVDMGGLSDFVNQLLNKVKEKLVTVLTTAVGTAIGATTGPAGALVGAAIGFIVGEVFNLFKSVWQDDIFRPAPLQIEIPSLTHRFDNGATDSGDLTSTFSGHGGKYQVVWDWHVF